MTVAAMETIGMRVDRSARTLRELALEKLRDAILDFQFKPGERLVERTLCDKLGVSRTVVREVLRHLETEGLVETLPQQGPAVVKLDVSQAAQVYEIRALLEAEASRAAAERATPAEIARLRTANDAIQAAFATGTSRHVLKATTEFYEILFTVAGKTVAWQVVQGLNARINHLRAMTIAGPGRAADAFQEMLRLLDAIESHDGEAAARASFDHVQTVSALAAAALAASGHLAPAAVEATARRGRGVR
ncbi:MAG TPA: GntR family transcriptional regulator [Lichenihabitans sp.]|nr:GntR family transcriptional regulator [Lichenihabitans sp.]